MAKYLDETGLSTLWTQIKNNFYSINDLGLEYDEGTKTIKLKGKGGDYIGDGISAAPFIKDGMLNDVFVINVTGDADSGFYYDPDGEEEGEPVKIEHPEVTEAGKYILFQWNTDAGENKIDIIKTSDIGATYTGSDSIDISGSNQLSVKEVGSNITKTTASIPVAGGPLADLVSKAGLYPDGIPADTDLQALLVSLFAKEIYPSASVSNGKLSSAFAKPNVSVANAGQTVEVGTPIAIGQFAAYEPGNTPTARTYSGFTNGWSAADDDTKDGDGNPASVQVSSISLNTGDYTVKRTYTLFGKSSDPTTTVTNADKAAAVITADNVVVEEGANKVKFDISGPGHKGTVVASPEYFIVSNFGNTDSTKKVGAQAQQDLSNATATAATQEYTVTGRYKFFFGYTSKSVASEMTSSEIRALNGVASGWINPTGNTQIFGESGIKSNGTSIVIAVPNTYELKAVSDKLGNDMKGTFNNIADVEVNLAGDAKTQYTVFMYPIVSGTQMELKNMTVGKK